MKPGKGMVMVGMPWLIWVALPWLFVACAAPEPHWRFLSMPDFLYVDTDYPQTGWDEALSYICPLSRINLDGSVEGGD